MLWTANGFARVRGTMEDKGSAARVPEVDLALWRRRREMGGALIGIYAVSLSTVSGFQSALNAMILILLLWMVASILLIIGAAFVSSFLRSLRTEAVSTEAFGGGGFLGYAITNAIGVFLFAGPLFIILLSP